MIGRIVICMFAAAALVACGPDENNDPNNGPIDANSGNNTNNTNNGTNSGTNNTIVIPNNGFGEECIDVECPEGRRCVRGVCVKADLKVACESPEDLGELAFEESYSGSADSSEFADGVSTTCAGTVGELSGAEWALSFTVPEPGQVTFELSNSDAPHEWVLELRQGDCAEVTIPEMNNFVDNNVDRDNPPPRCVDNNPSLSVGANPDTEYWILVEPNGSIDTGTFDWTVTFEPSTDVCEPGRVCMDETTLLVCDGDEEQAWSCPTGCLDGVCAGDECANAIEVTASMTWSGDSPALTDNLDFVDGENCSDDMSGGGTSTTGEEMIFSLPGLVAGQTVTIDASMDNTDNVIFVLSECSDAGACLAANDLGDILTWTVEADGDYFVVIDKTAENPEPFMYSIDIQ